MTIGAILIALEDYLRPLMTAQKGLVSVAETANDALQMLGGNAPEKWRVVLSTDGEKAPEDSGRSGHVVNEIIAYIQAPKGFEDKPGQSLHRKSTNDGASFMERLHWTVRKLRAVRFDHDEIDEQECLNYRGWEWVKYAEVPQWRAAKIKFEIGYAHDDPTTELPSPEPLPLPTTPALEVVGSYLHITVGGVTKRVRLLDLAP